jgi:uncharacterized membrane protein HdeD (DUF308 family)
MLAVAARQWWVLVLQGVLGILFGILAILFPGIALVTLALLFAIWAIASGISQVAEGLRVAESRGRSWPFAVTGGISILAGIFAFLLPGPTIIGLVLLLGAWQVAVGVMEIYTAWKIREQVTGEWMIALVGILRLVAGLVILYFPLIGALVTVAYVAVASIVSGIVALALGLRLRGLRESPGPDRTATAAG